jgi:uncharacterized protein YbjT (DUF2867 family)
MRVAVVGGTGSVGSIAVEELAARGDEVRVLSRSAPATAPARVSHRAVDLVSGEGLADALDGIDVVVDASNGRRDAEAVLVEGNRRLLDAEQAAGVRHHVGISIVGCDRVPMGYYGVKVRQEEVIAAGTVPWTLLRATQFHTLIAWLFESADRMRLLPTGAAKVQPVDPREAARRLADAAHAEPAGLLPELVGPRIQTLSELAAAWRAARPRARLPLRLPMLGQTARAIRAGGLCDPDIAGAGISFEKWLAER